MGRFLGFFSQLVVKHLNIYDIFASVPSSPGRAGRAPAPRPAEPLRPR